jgi:hypothetical protein
MNDAQKECLLMVGDIMVLISELNAQQRMTVIAALACLMSIEGHDTTDKEGLEWLEKFFFPFCRKGIPAARELWSAADMLQGMMSTKQ